MRLLESKPIIGKLLRFLINPRSCFFKLKLYLLEKRWVIKVYHRLIIPFIISRVRRKRRINVVFLAMSPDMWKYDVVYRKLVKDSRFNPVILTVMRKIPNMELRLQEQDVMVDYFTKRCFNVICGYDTAKKKWIDLKALKPDILFYTQPYVGVIESSFEYYNFLSCLICYTPYSFQYGEIDWEWNNTLQQYCWKLFYVNESNLQLCGKYSRIGSANATAVGYSLEEEYWESARDRDAANAAWKMDGRKRIIWAPHHSILEREMFKVSSFLEIADLMVTIREQYKDRIIFAFKPHPVLKTKLYDVWGRERTDLYFDDWAKSQNSFDAQGAYKALFSGSDAMIHCSGSFIVEYLYTGKPVAYVYSKVRNPPQFSIVGNAALEAHYSMHDEADIRRFIDKVVLGGNDTMADIRKKVADKYLRSPNGKMFSENVYGAILEGLGKRCLTH